MNFPSTNFTESLIVVVYICLTAGLGFSTLLVIKGPDLPTRVLALSLIGTIIAAIATTSAIITGQVYYINIAVTICLIEFLSTLAYARYIQRRRRPKNEKSRNLV